MQPNKIQFDTNALARHQQTGNNIRSMLDVLAQIQNEDDDIENDVEGAEIEESNDNTFDFSEPKTVTTKPTPAPNRIAFDYNALDNHRQNGLKGTIKNMISNFIGGLVAL